MIITTLDALQWAGWLGLPANAKTTKKETPPRRG